MLELSPEDQAAVRRAVAPLVDGATGIASLILERPGGHVLDVALPLGPGEAPFRRPLPDERGAAIDTWMQLLARRRGQLAHDLSGPATGVLAALETVLDYEPIPASSRDLLDDARRGMMRVSQVLLDSSSEPVSAPENMIEGPFSRLLARWGEEAAQRVVQGGEGISLEVDASPEVVRVDATALRGAVGVLLANAWRARRRSQVVVKMQGKLRPDHLSIHLEDDGAGMDAATLRRAGELGFAERASGVGLGLFSLRWALRRSGGVVVLDADARGTRAAVFTLRNAARG